MNLFNIILGAFQPMEATGGTITDITVSGKPWRVHTFLSSGNFNVTSTGTDPGVDYLIVAGGGAGGGTPVTSAGSTIYGGGGGAGGYLTNLGSLLVIPSQNFPVFVGNGGLKNSVPYLNGSPSPKGSNGENSSVFGLTAIGGGAGGAAIGSATGYNSLIRPPNSGGSGGGMAVTTTVPSNPAQGTAGQGNAGGGVAEIVAGQPSVRHGSGGGAGGVGVTQFNNPNPPSVVGGAGLSNSITGILKTYATGGATAPAANFTGASGAPNTGDGGQGGAANYQFAGVGGNGGSGIVVIRYPLEEL